MNNINEEWLNALKEAVNQHGAKNIASLLGYSRTTIELVCKGIYKHSKTNLEMAVRTKLLGYPPNLVAVADTLNQLREGITGDKDPKVLLPLVNQLEAILLHPTPHSPKELN